MLHGRGIAFLPTTLPCLWGQEETVETLLHDIRYAIRSMRKTPTFAAIAVLTLALGIGANTAIFTIINAVFLHPLPVEDASRLVQIKTTDPRNKNNGGGGLGVSVPNFQDIRERAQSFSAVIATVGPVPVS